MPRIAVPEIAVTTIAIASLRQSALLRRVIMFLNHATSVRHHPERCMVAANICSPLA